MYQAVKKEDDPKVASKMPEPKGYKLLISPVEVDEKTEGGVYMPDQMRDAEGIASIIGFVVSMGPDAYKDKDKFPNGAYCKKVTLLSLDHTQALDLKYTHRNLD